MDKPGNESVTEASPRQVSLKKLATRNSMLSLLLFALLVAIVVGASLKESSSMAALGQVYDDQFQVEKFKATLSDIIMPMNDYSMTADEANRAKISKAVKAYQASYKALLAIPRLTDEHKHAIAEVDTLMDQVMTFADDVAKSRIQAAQATRVTLVSLNLVLAAQKKLDLIAADMEQQLHSRSEERQQSATLHLYILLGLIVFIVLLLEFLNRGLLRHAQTVSKASSTLADSAGDIVLVNQMQAKTSDQQSRFMEKVTKGLELIAASGKEISTAVAGVEKNVEVIGAFAKDGAQQLEAEASALEHAAGGVASDAGEAAVAAASSDAIAQVVRQIQDLADEAQLLALNASIEESSRDDAAITGQVQRMSDQIREHCEDIQDRLKHLSGDSEQAIRKAGEMVGKSRELVVEMRTVFMRIENMSKKSGQSLSIIARATDGQNDQNHKILQALQHISELLHISGHKVQAYQDASARLSKASESLQNIA